MNETGLELRPMQPSDVPAVLNIIMEYDVDDATEARETYDAGLEGQYCLCERQTIIGVAGAKPIENTDGSFGMSWTYIQRSDRRSGKLMQMLKWVTEIMVEDGGRKVFVQISDDSNAADGDVYFDLREAYNRTGFIQEIRHTDFYAPGVAQLVLGMRLIPRQPTTSPLDTHDLKVTDIDEIPETNDVYWVAWDLVPKGQGTKPADFERIFHEVKSWGGRFLYMAFPSDLANVSPWMSAARFRMAGRLQDYYEDGVDELHFRYDLLS